MDIAENLDLANHRADSTAEQINLLCQNVIRYKFNSAFVNSYYVSFARNLLGDRGKVGTVVSFPLGQELLAIKRKTVRENITQGADELDISLNIGNIKSGKWDNCLEEMKVLVNEVKSFKSSVVVKFIPETGLLSDSEIKKTAELMVLAKADFFKTCSGLGPRGAIINDVKMIKEAVGDQIKIKVAGGISTYLQVKDFLAAGAVRIGTSKAVEIMQEVQKNRNE